MLTSAQALLLILGLGTLCVVVFTTLATPVVQQTQITAGGVCRKADSGAKPDWNRNAADMYLVKSQGWTQIHPVNRDVTQTDTCQSK